MKKRELPEDMEKLLCQLIRNGYVAMAGRALQLYACRCLKLYRESANALVLQYFEEVFPKELKHHRNKHKRPKKQSNP